MEEHLEEVDYTQTEYRKVKIRGFKHNSVEYKVDGTVAYKPWLFGLVETGKGQVGVYKVSSQQKNQIALIKDYIDHYGNWHFYLVKMANTLKEMEEYLLRNPQYGVVLLKFLAINK
ncbi:MAG: hypothetical protein QXF88_01005 [Candidatus Aenigmatarchaeota archaeon]